jgi:membrane protein implicated in regulation of membrane protease activity
VIRFSAGLVVVAIGVLCVGGVTSKLSLVYVAIAVSAFALIVLAIGVVAGRLQHGAHETPPGGGPAVGHVEGARAQVRAQRDDGRGQIRREGG